MIEKGISFLDFIDAGDGIKEIVSTEYASTHD